jgi:UDP-N-acetylglucosamine acyltransferase
MATLHTGASVDPRAELASDAEVGPYAIIGPGVTIGPGSRVGPFAIVERNARLGARVRIGPHSVIGGDPQDLKYAGEETWAEIGDDTVIREYVTVNRGTAESLSTTIGRGCLLMSSVHVGHDCHIGDGVIISNGAGLAGHVHVGARAIIGGMTGVHQFVHIGPWSFIGGLAKVTKDVAPYVRIDGNPSRPYGLNSVGLQRAGFSREVQEGLKQAYRLFFRSECNIGQAVERAGVELPQLPEVREFVDFIARSERGVLV